MDNLESMDLLELLVPKVNLVYLDSRVKLETMEKLDLLDLLVSPVNLDYLVPKEEMDHLV